MTMHPFNLNVADASWKECIQKGINRVDPDYLNHLTHSRNWLPGPQRIFNAFSLPLTQVNYVLFGESPYPRSESANGYAFWDASVNELWSSTGLSKKVNRATSLRNILKMLMVADGLLDKHHTNQDDIAKIDKQGFVQTNEELFSNLIRHGFLLLNATPVLQPGSPQKDARAWYPFTKEILDCLLQKRPHVTFILLGRIANTIDHLITRAQPDKLYAEHPYNLSFITNPKVLDFFRPLHLLQSSSPGRG
ncbi:Uracil-DNA glycosylase [Aquicella siphonis]|uniref:Uracil-DNA glycosylase n=1 Tax=Aquicella siphonis TaxID=254247 RepID=A0A5E4PIF7_9COXI|nr:uracil-DNA glycosylase [Aquicella siphonis]VVC76141.1 Uracil-DNA glycosylase [Aquicella siphonis]